MNAQHVRVNLPYDRADLKILLRYAKAHDIEVDGRYDFGMPPRLNIWTHPQSNPGCRAESSLMFSLEFDGHSAALMSVVMMPGYDWAIFLDEMTKLERAALGYVIYGKRREERIG